MSTSPARPPAAGPSSDPDVLLGHAREHDRVSLARLLSLVERGGEPGMAVARLAYRADTPYTVGITGAPGAGKSTLTDQLITVARRGWPGPQPGPEPQPEPQPANEPIPQLAVLAIDPTSPFSGGAILGDRVRMQQHALDPTVFIRSMATRGHLGGLALAVPDAVRVLGAVGFPLVIVETVGVGQMEVEVASAADTTVVVVTPGWGDSMQANKAGLLEVADLFVINKADRPGAREARRDLEQMLDLSQLDGWRPPIVDTNALSGEGVDGLWGAIDRHRAHLLESRLLERRRADRLAHELRRVLLARSALRIEEVASGEEFATVVKALAAGELDPYEAANRLMPG
ncbi:MAG TPA: methylmalonyl Co-A mutase-associated GTPase MeaB [Acidimicrobiales bacterium]|nr:methylmalonyl Co-A mutase-associated GTPase MeaB [Acidimicrobiales bacterium]